jgi:hypothetical protein
MEMVGEAQGACTYYARYVGAVLFHPQGQGLDACTYACEAFGMPLRARYENRVGNENAPFCPAILEASLSNMHMPAINRVSVS